MKAHDSRECACFWHFWLRDFGSNVAKQVSPSLNLPNSKG